MFKKTVLTILTAAAISGPIAGVAAAAPQTKSPVQFWCWDDSAESYFAPQCRDEHIVPKQRAKIDPRTPSTPPPSEVREEDDFFALVSMDGGGGGGGGGR